MSKRYSKSLAFIVLVSFLALLTPKSLWHDCSHGSHIVQEHSSKTGKHSIQQGYEKCQVCDLHIPLLSSPLTESRIASGRFRQLKITARVQSLPVSAVHHQLLRGPPVSMTA